MQVLQPSNLNEVRELKELDEALALVDSARRVSILGANYLQNVIGSRSMVSIVVVEVKYIGQERLGFHGV